MLAALGDGAARGCTASGHTRNCCNHQIQPPLVNHPFAFGTVWPPTNKAPGNHYITAIQDSLNVGCSSMA